jgi:glycosyltransferase involved in cell wall biosynthesis
MNQSDGITFAFPVYKDENTIHIMVHKLLRLGRKTGVPFCILIIDDFSPDNCEKYAHELAEEHSEVTYMYNHEKRGYGGCLRTAVEYAHYNLLCFIDGDNEYEANDFVKMLAVADHYDMVVGFRYIKRYSSWRTFMSWIYNKLIRFLFEVNLRDISTGIRVIRREAAKSIDLESHSPFTGAELAIKMIYRGYQVGEVGIQTFPNVFRKGSSVTLKNIFSTVRDMIRVYREIFSESYENWRGK